MKQRAKVLGLWLISGLMFRTVSAKDGAQYASAGITTTKFPASESTSSAKFQNLLKKATAGDADAQCAVGIAYAKGDGVPMDSERAVEWFQRSANQNFARAEYGLGILYEYGRGLHHNYLVAARWMRKAADQGYVKAQCEFGRMLANGYGVEEDHDEATKWYRKAADAGDARAQCGLGLMLVGKDMGEAVKWFRKSAEQGNVVGQYDLGISYLHGKGVQTDYEEAAKWIQMAAAQGYTNASRVLAHMGWRSTRPDSNPIAKIPPRPIEPDYAKITTSDGKIYKNVILENIDPDGITVEFEPDGGGIGIKKLEFKNLPDSLRQQFGYDPKKAADFESGQGQITPKRWAPVPEQDGREEPELGISEGSGFFVTDDGYLVTCAHVVRGATTFHVKTSSGTYSSRLVAKDVTVDIALLKLTGSFAALSVPSDPQTKLGDSVFTIGFPNPDLQGIEPKLTRGEISSLAGIHDDPRCFQISVPVQPGNSGGALVDERGNVVGVVSARLADIATYEASGSLPQNVNYAVKGGLVYTFLSKVPELSGKLKTQRTVKDQASANIAAEAASVLVIAE